MHLLKENGEVNCENILNLLKAFDLGFRGLSSNGELRIALTGQFYVKFLLQMNTLLALKKGLPLEFDGQIKAAFDHSSALIIARTMLETYINFAHIYVTPKTKEESTFRFNCWHLNGLLSRNKILKIRPHLAQTQKASVEADQKEIVALKELIAKDAHFQLLDLKQQKRILKGQDWRQKQITEIAREAGLDHGFAQTFYIFTSGHTHTDSVNILQSHGRVNLEKREGIEHAAQYTALIAVKFLHDLLTMFPSGKLAITEDQLYEIKVCAEKLCSMG